MSFLNKIGSAAKSALWEDDSQPAQQTAQAASVKSPATGAATPTFVATNNQFVEAIRKQVFSRNTAFTALTSAADALKDIIPDPVMRLKAAHKTGGLGRSTKEFSDAITIHLSDVDGEERRFMTALDQRVQADVGGLKAQAQMVADQSAALANSIKAMQEQIAQAQTQIAEKTQQVAQLTAQAQQQEIELRQSEQEFKAAAQTIRDELNTQRAAITSTLG